MRVFTLLAILSLLLISCGKEQADIQPIKAGSNAELIRNPISYNSKKDTSEMARLVFDEKVYDFGTIIQGESIIRKYTFTNTGKTHLLISDASSSCGCTIPKIPDGPIPPGKKGFVEVKFNSANKSGFQNKRVTVYSNAYPNKSLIFIKGDIIKPDNQNN